MKSSGIVLLTLLCATLLVLDSCVTPSPVAPSQPGKTEVQGPLPTEPKAQPQNPAPPAEAAKPEPVPAKPPAPAQQRQPIEVSKEVYSKTFSAVEKVIEDLNKIISARNFEAWKSYLTPQYTEEMSMPSTLQKLSDSPILKRNNIVLKSLDDYFQYVVAPSRSNARLDDLVFLDKNTVEAIMVVRGQRVILYQLENRDGKWKIGLF